VSVVREALIDWKMWGGGGSLLISARYLGVFRKGCIEVCKRFWEDWEGLTGCGSTV
jgi:hypothetical protein